MGLVGLVVSKISGGDGVQGRASPIAARADRSSRRTTCVGTFAPVAGPSRAHRVRACRRSVSECRPAGPPALLRACIVDEHAAVREWLTGKLDSVGIETSAASGTVADGVEAIRTHRPDLVVVDNRLPDGRGVDLCREVSDLVAGPDPHPAHGSDQPAGGDARPTRPE